MKSGIKWTTIEKNYVTIKEKFQDDVYSQNEFSPFFNDLVN